MDVYYKSKKPAAWYLKRLKGRKHLMQGNHTIVLCHFPIAEWDRALNAGCRNNNYTPVTIEQHIKNNRIYKQNHFWDLYGNREGPWLWNQRSVVV